MSKRESRPLTAADYRRIPERCTARVEVYEVRSRSCPDAPRTVIRHRRPESWGCDCPATVRCAHIDLVRYEEAARPWRDHWRRCPDVSLVTTDREFASRPATLTADERLQWATLGDELARRGLTLDAVAALLRSPGSGETRAAGRKAVADLFGGE